MVDSTASGYMQATGTVPLSDDELADALQAWVVGITGITGSLVRPRWQSVAPNRPGLDVDWCAIGVTEETPEAGIPYLEQQGDDDSGTGTERLQRYTAVDILASFYGPHAARYAGLLLDGATIRNNLDELALSGLVFIDSGPIRSVPEQFQQIWVYRVDLPIKLARQIRRVYPVRNVVRATGTITSVTSHSQFDTENA